MHTIPLPHPFFCRQTTKGLELLDKAIQQAPSLIELFTTRARLLKHAGDYEGAAHLAETARRMDLSDRYLNSIAVKALFAAGKPEEAAKTAALFTKDGEQLSLLHDMQHMWYEYAAGTAYLKREEWGKALKQFTHVISHFKDIEEDQFDFHNYCMRKTTLRAYVETLRMEDRLFGHPFYARAAQGAITAYLALHDAPSSTQTEANEEALMAGMSSEDRKKYKLKKKKEEKQKSKEEEEARSTAAASKDQASKPGDKGKKGEKKEADPDPDGAKLASTPEPLEEASKLVASLKEHAAGLLETQLLALQVYLRKGKMLLALSAAQRAAANAGPQHPQVHLAIVRFCSRAQSHPAPDMPAPHPEVASLIKTGQEKLLGSKHATSVKAYNDEWLATHCQDNSSRGDTLAVRQAGAEALLVLAGAGQVPLADAKVQAAKLLTSAAPLSGVVTKRRHEQCVAVTKLLEEDIADTAAAKRWREACSQAFPFSRFFGGSRIVELEPGLLDMTNMTKAFGYLSFQ
ncbi:NMDA receptor-regulated protein 1-domain-containing protein [Dunaliella salina]|uniref:NMDA receptor-regulated protein 1-domain-containing protein n=1 Tax=Dunaliella salina TaxID=3046 RepID=A0ABQ7GFN1_DUNSA|nr:NMDA receptor-regulated protein 1-domain-containing protein [Dunaliella salina]|eukprot:KAF5833413.1 NMDA receptor-regulated protein 1-domain-containing protein [Dunaliella salina]